MAREKFLVKSGRSLSIYPGGKNLVEIILSHTVFEINVFYTEIQAGRQNGGKTIFGKKCHTTASTQAG